MQSFLILSKDKNKVSSYISNFLKENNINPLDVDSQSFEKAMGIEDARNIQKKILLKPFRGKAKAVIIDVFEGITTEAQNALLKVLEEPPANTIIMVLSPQKELLLPTIISRCKIIEIKNEDLEIGSEEISSLSSYVNILLNERIGDKLKIAQDLSKNKQTLVWLENTSIFVRHKLLEDPNNLKFFELLRKLQKTYAIIKSTNVSERVALENLFLSLYP